MSINPKTWWKGGRTSGESGQTSQQSAFGPTDEKQELSA